MSETEGLSAILNASWQKKKLRLRRDRGSDFSS